MKDVAEIGARIRDVRREVGLTQRDLADLSRVSERTVAIVGGDQEIQEVPVSRGPAAG